MKKAIFALAAAGVAAIALTAPAHAAVVAWNGTGADDTLGWGQLGGVGTSVASGTGVTSTGGLGATVTSQDGTDMTRVNQGNGWNGNFAPGDTLLWNIESAGDITITFDTAVRAAGAQFQSNYFGAFTARITTSDGSFFDLAGVSSSGGDDSAIFIGAISDTANISSIRFHRQDGINDFAIGDLSLVTGGIVDPIPEPATWAMMIGGFGLVGAAMRRRTRVAVSYA